jgi:hypothetical protein
MMCDYARRTGADSPPEKHGKRPEALFTGWLGTVQNKAGKESVFSVR